MPRAQTYQRLRQDVQNRGADGRIAAASWHANPSPRGRAKRRGAGSTWPRFTKRRRPGQERGPEPVAEAAAEARASLEAEPGPELEI